MTLVTRKFTVLFGAVGAAALLGGCPEATEAPDARIPQEFDAAGGGADADVTPDAPPPMIDAGPDLETTVAILDTTVTNDLTALGIASLRGNATSISLSDLNADTGVLAFGTPGALTGCSVHTYDLAMGQAPPAALDSGTVTIVGGTPTPGQCTFNAMAKTYICVGAAGAAPATSAIAVGPQAGTAVITLPGDTIPGNVAGAALSISGATTASNNGVFPIVAVTGADTYLVAKQTATTPEPLPATATYALITNPGPTPNHMGDYLAMGDTVAVTKAAGMTSAINLMNITPAGVGLTLATASVKPDAVPFTSPAGDVVFDCAGAGGTCGPDGSLVLKGVIVSGRTTDGATGGTLPFQMPTPTAKVATFTCVFLGGGTATIPKAAWDAILATNPTRIETRFLKVTGDISADGQNRVLVGHALVGFTTKP